MRFSWYMQQIETEDREKEEHSLAGGFQKRERFFESLGKSVEKICVEKLGAGEMG